MPNPNLKIVVEENIPFLRGLLDRYASVKYLPSGAIDAKALADADAIIVRTRTRCDAALLAGSRCKLVATATIGTDHIDLPWCAQHNITVVNAPGCNAPAVAQYVFASLLAVVNRPLADLTIGIVGIGHVGSIVENWARSLGMRVMLCDPPRQLAEGGDHWHTLDEIASRADIVTFHVPLTVDGDHPTHHLIGSGFLDSLRRAPVIINSSRGAVADTAALLRAAKTGKIGPLIIDCWEGEPDIDRGLLEAATIATPHIAGYSRQGKVRASQVVLDAVTTMFMLPRITIDQPLPPAPARSVCAWDVAQSYDPMADTSTLKSDPDAFEGLRNHYAFRDEVAEGRQPD